MRFFFNGLFGVAIVACLSSCSKDDDPTKVAPAGTMVATIDGLDWQSTAVSAYIGNGTITVAGSTDDQGIQVAVLKSQTTGTFKFQGGVVPEASLSLTPDNEVAYATAYFDAGIEVGAVTISEIDETNKTVSGTFTGKVKRMTPTEEEIEIKEGSFQKIPYITQGSGGSNNTFSAKVAGTSFNATIKGGVKAFSSISLNFSTSDGSKAINIVVPENVTTGTHNFGSFGEAYFATYTANSSTYESVSGNVKITVHNTTTKRIEGTFSFSAEPFPAGGTAIAITEGSFAVTY